MEITIDQQINAIEISIGFYTSKMNSFTKTEDTHSAYMSYKKHILRLEEAKRTLEKVMNDIK
jgi:hypothetical protein